MTLWRSRRSKLHRAERGLFDAAWYARTYCPGADDAAAWQQFDVVGRSRGHRPNPLFDPSWYRDTYRLCGAEAALSHFAASGSRQGLWPSPLFETDWYARANANVAAMGIDPLVHYLRHGRHEGRAPASWCVELETAGCVKDLALSADFALDDLVGYLPRYQIADRLTAAPDAQAFFSPAMPRLVFAAVRPSGLAANPIDRAVVIGGRREILVGGCLHAPTATARPGDSHRAFAVTYVVSPVQWNALHLLGREPAGEDNADPSGPSDSAKAATSLLVDVGLSGERAQAVRARFNAKAALVPLARGAMCGVRQLHVPGYGLT